MQTVFYCDTNYTPCRTQQLHFKLRVQKMDFMTELQTDVGWKTWEHTNQYCTTLTSSGINISHSHHFVFLCFNVLATTGHKHFSTPHTRCSPRRDESSPGWTPVECPFVLPPALLKVFPLYSCKKTIVSEIVINAIVRVWTGERSVNWVMWWLKYIVLGLMDEHTEEPLCVKAKAGSFTEDIWLV